MLDPAEQNQIDQALRVVDREVWVITAANAGRRGGLVATWVAAASIDRQQPMILAGIGPNHFTAELVQASRAFGAHLLRPDQVELAWNFARDSGRQRDKLCNLAIEQGSTGAPILADCLAWFDCRVFARYDAGDRLLFWADVAGGTLCMPSNGTPTRSAGAPAPTTLREQAFFQGLSDEQRQMLIAARDAEAELYRPLNENWRLAKPW